MTKQETALSAVVERTFPLSEFGDDLHDYLQRGLRDVLYADLTALISEHYVSREEYDEEKKSNALLHKAMVTAEKGGHDKAMEEISEHYYPKEFVRWLLNGYTFLKRDQSFVVNYPYLTEYNDYRHFTTDELFNYWRENER